MGGRRLTPEEAAESALMRRLKHIENDVREGKGNAKPAIAGEGAPPELAAQYPGIGKYWHENSKEKKDYILAEWEKGDRESLALEEDLAIAVFERRWPSDPARKRRLLVMY